MHHVNDRIKALKKDYFIYIICCIIINDFLNMLSIIILI
ncbi:hypothetical protein A1OE_173 [Candidatus Endolissoclinum faulkneri L2]|uniref:Uncharacterized protein n=1 Tax=Candidatus Endolissoclinum faulkneri L2 TaxID=1193729 RepID=K7ZC83_9PROT|nr:hypothetical protein A1OE_173 [Candidatus Endolissoclinum faulkneri L2]